MFLISWIMVVFFVVFCCFIGLNSRKVIKMFMFGLGFVFNRNKMDWFVWLVFFKFRGVNKLWLIVLLKNNIFKGFKKMWINGKRLVLIN